MRIIISIARNLYLPYVLEEREGMPVSLGALVLLSRRKFKIADLSGEFPDPTDFTCGSDGEVAFIDPWCGKYISVDELKKLYEGAFGLGLKFNLRLSSSRYSDAYCTFPSACQERFNS